VVVVFRFFILLFTVWICTTTAFAVQKLAQNETYSLAFFAPRGEGDPFWGKFIGFMEKATLDFGMELKVHYAEGNLEKMREQIVSEAKSTERADILVFPNFKKGGETFLKIIEEQQIPAFVVNSGFTEEEECLGGNTSTGLENYCRQKRKLVQCWRNP